MRWQRGIAGIVVATLVAWLVAGTSAGASDSPGGSSFSIGFADGVYLDPAIDNAWITRTLASGAQFVLLPVDWANIAGSRPPSGSDPTNPANPDYNWGTLDQTVRALTARGLTVAFTVAGGGGGPAWADGPHRPPGVQPGTWRPDAAAFGAFAKAVARRYSGSFNPGNGVLPHVRYYQAWGEPNLYNHLTPQWVKAGRRWIAESPVVYRQLLNAFYAAVKSVDGSNVVVTAGTAPYGDPPGGGRMSPAVFVRHLLCLNNGLERQSCPAPAHFDVLAHDPYEIGGPFTRAFNHDDVTVPDMAKLTRPLRVAVRDGTALPAAHKDVWVTEFSWDSKPPDPHAVPILTRAYWIEESFYELWREGVSAMAWFLIRDQPCQPNCASSYQSGMYYLNGHLKPDLEGFRFPFVAETARGGRSRLWGVSPTAGTVLVQRQSGKTWQTAYRFSVPAHGVFTRVVSLSSRVRLRALIGSESSLVWPKP